LTVLKGVSRTGLETRDIFSKGVSRTGLETREPDCSAAPVEQMTYGLFWRSGFRAPQLSSRSETCVHIWALQTGRNRPTKEQKRLTQARISQKVYLEPKWLRHLLGPSERILREKNSSGSCCLDSFCIFERDLTHQFYHRHAVRWGSTLTVSKGVSRTGLETRDNFSKGVSRTGLETREPDSFQFPELLASAELL
jgi:hypothetical protein